MSVILCEETRGEVVESLSRGDIAVVDTRGELLYYAGDPGKFTYLRSAAKPLLALEVILSGASQYYGFTDREVAVMCASHFGEPMHRGAVESILTKIGLTREAVLGGHVTSLDPRYASKLACEHVPLNPLFSDCSGKHAGMLSICKYRGYSLDSYTHPDHPLQQELLQLLARLTRYDKEAIAVGVDGCSVPVHAMPLRHMAEGFARLATPGQQAWAPAAGNIYRAMNRYPEMIAGTGGFCSDLIRHTHGKLIGKIGAQGVYCIGIRNKNMGIAVKMEDGHMERLKPVVIKILEDLGLLTWQEAAALRPYRLMNNRNDLESIVGEIRAVFELEEAHANQR